MTDDRAGSYIRVNPPTLKAHKHRCYPPTITNWNGEDSLGPGTIWACGYCPHWWEIDATQQHWYRVRTLRRWWITFKAAAQDGETE